MRVHDSDCSTHNMPAMKNCECDCGFYKEEKMFWNGNEIVFENFPNHGVAGIPHDMPDSLAETIVLRWNAFETMKAALLKILNREYCMVSGCHKNNGRDDCWQCADDVCRKAFADIGRCEHGRLLADGCDDCSF